MTLVKASLVDAEGGADIEFMFNPTELSFSQKSNVNPVEGARTPKGLPKVSFAYPDPCVLTIKDINFDTYEKGTSVMTYVNKFKGALDFAKTGPGANKRPPVYKFTWGGEEYLRCFVSDLSYSLTLFLPDGTPVRAKMSLTLKEVDEAIVSPSVDAPKEPDRIGGGR